MTPPAAKRSVIVYLLAVAAVSAVLQTMIARSGRPVGENPLIVALMWTPGVVSIVVRLVLRQGFGDVSWRVGGRRTFAAIGVVCAYPIVVGGLAYGAAWATGLATFHPPASTFGIAPTSDAARFLLRLGAMLLPGIPLSMVTALGEEIGWRGFFVLRLVEAGVKRPLLVSGLVWGLWHVPLILTGQYAAGPSPFLSALVFLVSIMPAAYLIGWSRLATGSVWPAAVAHAVWNAVIQGAFDASTTGSSSAHATNIWIGESGLLVAGMSVIVTAIVLRIRFPVLPRPGAEPIAELSLRTS
jgi:membrane protease YdiL (CAAX protease family)